MLDRPRHYVYRHIRKDTGEIFYIGKGSRKPNNLKDFGRATCRHGNPRWQHIADKHGFEAEVMILCQTDAEAQEKERFFIALYGRADLKRGPLVNYTDGGDGHAGIIISPSARAKRSANAKKPRSKAWIDAIRKARYKGGNGGVVKKGDKLPKWWRERISKAIRGENNSQYGKVTAVAKPVRSPEGVEYPSLRSAIKATGNIHIAHELNGQRLNLSGFTYI